MFYGLEFSECRGSARGDDRVCCYLFPLESFVREPTEKVKTRVWCCDQTWQRNLAVAAAFTAEQEYDLGRTTRCRH